ncbi:MAG: thymidine phosphorylase [bacterium]
MFNPVEIIKLKRENRPIPKDSLALFIKEYASGRIPDYQMSAFLMAVFLQGMTVGEMVTLVHSMRDSGKVLDLSDIDGFKLGKHSTGGVGDKISLVLAPLLASMGISIPMISGRGLGHSGGTLDKLESIPGLNPVVSLAKFKRVLKKVGFVISGQTDELVPADRRMYSLRDVTATIESIPLVVGSIMSKKLAEDLDGLLLDVKTGKGAFFRSQKDAIHLAKLLIQVGLDFGVETRALLTDMDQPTGCAVGNWLEVQEAIQCLRGEGPSDTMELVYSLGIVALRIAGDVDAPGEIVSKLQQSISSGRALEKFFAYVHELGGDTSVIEKDKRFPLPREHQVLSQKAGNLSAIDAYEIGMASCLAGAGRLRMEDDVDHFAGILLRKQVGEGVEIGEPLATFYTRKDIKPEIENQIRNAITISETPGKPVKPVRGEIDRNGRLVSFGI